MKNKTSKIRTALAGGLLTLLNACGPNETYNGNYEGFKVEAFYEGPSKKVIISRSMHDWSYISRVIGTDYPNDGEGFQVKTLYLPEKDPLKELATPEHLQRAWEEVTGDK